MKIVSGRTTDVHEGAMIDPQNRAFIIAYLPPRHVGCVGRSEGRRGVGDTCVKRKAQVHKGGEDVLSSVNSALPALCVSALSESPPEAESQPDVEHPLSTPAPDLARSLHAREQHLDSCWSNLEYGFVRSC